MEGISWEEFLENIRNIAKISSEIGDKWQLIEKNEHIAGTYLVKQIQKTISLAQIQSYTELAFDDHFEHIAPCEANDPTTAIDSPINLELLKFEYHILYHLSYGVPYLSFNAYKSNGSMITIEEAWNIFKNSEKPNNKSFEMTSILTQMDHPVLFKPFLTLHPCKTAEILNAASNSQNKVLTFISSIGPAVHLDMDLEYANYFNDRQSNI